MTDRLKGIVVAFDADIREDDARKIIDAVLQLRGVCAVTPALVTPADWINRARVKRELLEKMTDLLTTEH